MANIFFSTKTKNKTFAFMFLLFFKYASYCKSSCLCYGDLPWMFQKLKVSNNIDRQFQAKAKSLILSRDYVYIYIGIHSFSLWRACVYLLLAESKNCFFLIEKKQTCHSNRITLRHFLLLTLATLIQSFYAGQTYAPTRWPTLLPTFGFWKIQRKLLSTKPENPQGVDLEGS